MPGTSLRCSLLSMNLLRKSTAKKLSTFSIFCLSVFSTVSARVACTNDSNISFISSVTATMPNYKPTNHTTWTLPSTLRSSSSPCSTLSVSSRSYCTIPTSTTPLTSQTSCSTSNTASKKASQRTSQSLYTTSSFPPSSTSSLPAKDCTMVFRPKGWPQTTQATQQQEPGDLGFRVENGYSRSLTTWNSCDTKKKKCAGSMSSELPYVFVYSFGRVNDAAEEGQKQINYLYAGHGGHW